MKRSPLFALIATASLAVAVLAPAISAASSEAGSIATTCTANGIHGPVVRSASFAYSADSPTRVEPGGTFSLALGIAYAVPTGVTSGYAIVDVTGGIAAGIGISAPPGSPSITNSLSITATAPVGGEVVAVLRTFGAFTQLGQFIAGENCNGGVVVARIPVSVDPLPSGTVITVGDASAAEGNSGAPRLLKVPVTLSQPSSVPVTVQYTVTNGTASGGTRRTPGADFVANPTTRTLTFLPTRTGLTPTVKYVSISVLPDTTIGEGSESISIDLVAPSGGYALRDPHGQGTIIDDDGGTGITVAIGDVTVTEGDSGTRAISLLVSLSEPITEPVQVPVTVTGVDASCGLPRSGVAPAGSDCWLFPRIPVLTFAPGATSRTATIHTVADTQLERDETFTVQLGTPTGASQPIGILGTGAAIVTQLDDDA